jgi:hypothetical protein
MLDASKLKGCVPVVRLHATCMAVRSFNPLLQILLYETVNFHLLRRFSSVQI